MKVLVLTDGQGWIVDRITKEMVSRIPFEFIVKDYTTVSTQEILDTECDLIHYQNWDIERHYPAILKHKAPIIVSCRSHRFPEYFKDVALSVHVHVVNKDLLKDFPDATYIPDAIADHMFKPLTVGMQLADNEPNKHYKGYYLVKEACEILGAKFTPALGNVTDMPAWYDSIDVYVCASENEGFNTGVAEALARNKPVISTAVGVTKAFPSVHFVERTTDSILAALREYETTSLVKPLSWGNISKQFKELYEHVTKI